jgi:ABC-2 type transport system permease protein
MFWLRNRQGKKVRTFAPAMDKSTTRRSPRAQALLQMGLIVGILFFANFLANIFYTHFDLTEEKRFTLTKPTRALLQGLDERVYVEVLLDGEFPAGFKRLQNATRETLDDFRSETGYVDYQFEDPSEGSIDDVNDRRKVLSENGVNPVNLRVMEQGESTQKLIYPFAIVHYKNRKMPVKLLENESPTLSPDEVINNSVSLLEYKLANAIKKLEASDKPIVLFTDGHGELDKLQTTDLERSLSQFYETGRIVLDSVIDIPTSASLANQAVRPGEFKKKPCELLIVAKPRAAFSERDKFKLDQYVMNGGKVIWLIDRLGVTLDSMRMNGHFVPRDYPINLEDQLFKYGVRIQPDLILDLQCTKIPLQTGVVGNAPQFEMFQWYYHPAVLPSTDHPIVKNLDRTELRFCSSIDTIRTKTPVKKTIVMRSSRYSRLQFSPIDLSFDILRYDADPTKFDKGERPVGVLLEGTFPSNYENRVSQEMAAGLAAAGIQFKPTSLPTRMLVISDGDVAANPTRIDETGKETWLPLGFNKFERTTYSNKDLLLNAVEYLSDASGVIEARSREVKLRLLDGVRAKSEKTFWQSLNIGVSLAFIALFGVVFAWWRKRKYAAA